MKRWTTQFKIKNKDFYNLDTLINNLYDYAETLDDDIDNNAAVDAATVAQILSENYKSYYDYAESHDETYKYEGTKVKLSHSGGRYHGAPTLEVRKTKDGYHVLMSGKDIIYQEYGTGTVGQDDGYPDKLPDGYTYGGGPKVLQGGAYKNGGNLKGGIPEWYQNLLEEGAISESDMIWRSPRGITKGDHAGAFMYNTYEEVMDELDNPNSTVLKNGRRNLNIMVSNKITKGLK